MKIRRGTMPLRGIDPMGEEYLALRDELDQAASPSTGRCRTGTRNNEPRAKA